MLSPSKLKQQIIKHLRQSGEGGLRRPDLRRRIAGAEKDRDEKFLDSFREVFRKLMDSGQIMRKRGGRYILSETAGLLTGKLSVNTMRGFAFFTPDDMPEMADVFIPPQNLEESRAVTGDRVQIRLVSEDDRGKAGEIVRILERSSEAVIGIFEETEQGFQLCPLRKELPETIELRFPKKKPARLKSGDWIEARLLPPDHSPNGIAAKFVAYVATGSNITGILDAVTREFGLAPPYTAEQTARAGLAPREIKREDCRDLFVVTIDPKDAKDCDDGLSITFGPKPGTVTVGVHIADVAAYVAPGGELDKWARERAFTAYLPGRTLPMMPRLLAAERCSLGAESESFAHSVFLEIDRSSGDVLSSRRTHTLISVKKRLTFDEVRSFTNKETTFPPELATAIKTLIKVCKTMRRRRQRTERFLHLAIPEIRVLSEENPPRILGLKQVEADASHELVEEFMLAANTAVAKELHERKVPGVYRNHPSPKADELMLFGQWARFAIKGVSTKLTDRATLNRFLEEVAKSPLSTLILTTFLRTMPRAVYESTPSGHFGLGKEFYSHFTSPIRRYTDLLIHQQLWDLDSGRQPTHSLDTCTTLAAHCTALEENNDAAYYAAVDRLKLQYLRDLTQKNPREDYTAVVAKVVNRGLFVLLPDFALQGFVSLPEKQNLSYACGDSLRVQITRADIARGTLDLKTANAPRKKTLPNRKEKRQGN